MELLKAYGEAWLYFGRPDVVLFMLGGMISAIIIGIIPGLGGAVVLSLFLIFVRFLTPEQALPFMAAEHAVSFTGGAVTTVLLGIPGTSANAATLLDGYVMTQRGEAGRSLGLAVGSSGAGSVYSAVFALAMIPVIVPFVLAIASPEMIFIVLLGICMIATLSRGSTIKGTISGLLGIVVSLIGYHLVTGIERFTFGSLYLRDGLPVVPVFIGLFAIPEMVLLAASGSTISKVEAQALGGLRGIMTGVKELKSHLRLNLISSIIGYIVGIIPGIGGVVASWVAYGQAKQTSKHPERFGTGCPEGIIAPESANNATSGGSLLTTLALGVPGSEGGVLILAALIILGITPGPKMITGHLPLVLNTLLITAVTGFLAAAICIVAAPQLAKVTRVSSNTLFPLVIAIVVAGVFVSQGLFQDLVTLFVFGILGLIMVRTGFNRAAFVLGFILGSLFEKYLFISLSSYGPLFFLRPISLALIVLNIVLLVFPALTRVLKPDVSKLKGADDKP